MVNPQTSNEGNTSYSVSEPDETEAYSYAPVEAEPVPTGSEPPRTNDGVPGWDVRADDADPADLTCPNPDCESVYTPFEGQTAAPLACPVCGTNFTAGKLVFTPSPQALENEVSEEDLERVAKANAESTPDTATT